jgi:hypothetical protein
MTLNVEAQVAALQHMTVDELRRRYAAVMGEPARSRHKTHLIRKIAWRIQALAEGDLSERARRRAAELANDADVRVTPPKGHRVATGGQNSVQADVLPDNRLPGPGGAIFRKYKGQMLRVNVEAGGTFEYDGQRYKSLSAIAKAISGSHCNGFRFFGLEGKR